MVKSRILVLILLITHSLWLSAQTNPVQVPDVNGLNVPQAAALLNKSGINLGQQIPIETTDGALPNTIQFQGVPPDTSVNYGTAIDIGVVSPSIELTTFIYLAYTDNALALVNTSKDKWMPTNQTSVYNYNAALAIVGVEGVLGDPEVLREDHRVGLGNITLLAPNQCIVYTTTESGVTEPPIDCDVVAQRALSQDVVVWVNDFEVESSIDGRIQNCPDSIEGKLIRCIVRR